MAAATTSPSNRATQTTASYGTVEVNYPSYELRETLNTLRPNAGLDGMWIVIDLGAAATIEACKTACTVLQHSYPGEVFVVSTVRVTLAS